MTKILDQTADVGYRELHAYSKQYGLPEYVKEASAEESIARQELAKLPSAMFADVKNRQFPIHTKSACFLSHLHFIHKRPQMHQKLAEWTEERLNHYAKYHGIEKDVAELQEKYAETWTKQAEDLSDDCYALVRHTDQGKSKQYPLRNVDEVVKAAEWFCQYRDAFVFRDRQTIATKILEKAARLDVTFDPETDELLEKQAGRGLCDAQSAAKMIRDRVKAASHNCSQELRDAMTKVASDVAANPQMFVDPTFVAELCATVDQFDRTVKLAGKYDEAIPRPEDVLFRGSLKQAAEFVKSAVELVSGTIYERSQFRKLALSQIRDSFGDEIANEVSDGLTGVNVQKMAEVAITLPRPDAELLEKLMKAAGQEPFAKQASEGVRVSNTQWRQIAEARR